MTTFTDTDSIPDGEYIIRVSVEVGEDGIKMLCLVDTGSDRYLLSLDSFLELGGVLESEWIHNYCRYCNKGQSR